MRAASQGRLVAAPAAPGRAPVAAPAARAGTRPVAGLPTAVSGPAMASGVREQFIRADGSRSRAQARAQARGAATSDALARGLASAPRAGPQDREREAGCRAAMSSDAPSSSAAPPLPSAPVVKVCGVTSASDAEHAASCGAGMIGMIVWPGAKRSVSASTARSIVSAARGAGAEPVGVFVSESAEEIRRVAREIGLRTVQLHGQGSREALSELLEGARGEGEGESTSTGEGENEADASSLSVVYVVPVSPEGDMLAALPPPGAVDWLLLDPPGGGTGQTWDWGAAAALAARAAPRRGWLVAGGLGPHNVRAAVRNARPNGVDASSGVAGSDGLAKDRVKVEGYVRGGIQALEEIWGA